MRIKFMDANTLSEVGLKLFLAISKEWDLNSQQQCILLNIDSPDILKHWAKIAAQNDNLVLPDRVIIRLSIIAGICRGIQSFFDTPEQWKSWIHKPNQLFNGQSALQRMLSGNEKDLMDVRKCIDGYIGENYF